MCAQLPDDDINNPVHRTQLGRTGEKFVWGGEGDRGTCDYQSIIEHDPPVKTGLHFFILVWYIGVLRTEELWWRDHQISLTDQRSSQLPHTGQVRTDTDLSRLEENFQNIEIIQYVQH